MRRPVGLMRNDVSDELVMFAFEVDGILERDMALTAG
jgi:hypothetical protein